MAKRYNLKSEIQRVKAKHPPFELQLPAIDGGEAGVSYEEKIVLIPAAQTLSDDLATLTATNPVRAAVLILGGDYEHYTAAGGSAMLLVEMIRDYAGAATTGESPAS